MCLRRPSDTTFYQGKEGLRGFVAETGVCVKGWPHGSEKKPSGARNLQTENTNSIASILPGAGQVYRFDTTPKAGQSGSVHAGTLGSSRPSWVNRSAGAKQANKSWHGSRLLQSPPPSSFPAPPGLPIKQMGPGVLWSISLPFTREKRIYRKGELSPICDLPQGSLQGAVSFTHPPANGKREK